VNAEVAGVEPLFSGSSKWVISVLPLISAAVACGGVVSSVTFFVKLAVSLPRQVP